MTDSPFMLVETEQGLSLKLTDNDKPQYVCIDFLSPQLQFRLKQASLKKESVAKAMGVKPKDHPHIVDATAGLGRDSLILAALGFNVTMIERSPLLYALLNDAMRRASLDTKMADIIANMTLLSGDSLCLLKQITPKADVIYLDPMFPPRKKSALVKKDILLLHKLLGEDEDTEQLLKVALTCASKRVVIKRPKLAPAINQSVLSFSLQGKTSRFDIYLV